MNVSMVKLTSFSDRIEAEMLKSFLVDSGINVIIHSDDSFGINNGMTAANGVFIIVPREQLEDAQVLLNEYLNHSVELPPE